MVAQLQDCQRGIDYDQINTLKKKFAEKCVKRRNEMSDAIYPQKHIISKFRKKLYNSEIQFKNQFGPELRKKNFWPDP